MLKQENEGRRRSQSRKGELQQDQINKINILEETLGRTKEGELEANGTTTMSKKIEIKIEDERKASEELKALLMEKEEEINELNREYTQLKK